MARKQNASTIRTRKLLHEAVLKLAENQDTRSLTVNQIAEAAGLNRTTFYLHYQDVASLMEAAFDELLELMNEGGWKLLDWDATSQEEWEETFYMTLAERPKLFARLMSAGRSDPLGRRFIEVLTRSTRAVLNGKESVKSLDPEYREMLAQYATAGVLGMSIAWLEADMPVDAKQICRWNWAFLMQLCAMPQPPEPDMNEYLRPPTNTTTLI